MNTKKLTYKDLSVYKRAYRVAIDLHCFLCSKESKVIPQHASELRKHSKEALANIAEGFYQKSPKAKRFYNFKARDIIIRIVLDLDYLLDTKAIPDYECSLFQKEYNACSKQLYKLNEALLEINQ